MNAWITEKQWETLVSHQEWSILPGKRRVPWDIVYKTIDGLK